MIKQLIKVSMDKYTEYTKELEQLCLVEASKGNVHLVLTTDELNNKIGIPNDPNNLELLRTCEELEIFYNKRAAIANAKFNAFNCITRAFMCCCYCAKKYQIPSVISPHKWNTLELL